MNKIDLIVDAIQFGYDSLEWGDIDKVAMFKEALTAAKELQALQPVLWKASGDGWSYEKPLFPATPLYALDEVTK